MSLSIEEITSEIQICTGLIGRAQSEVGEEQDGERIARAELAGHLESIAHAETEKIESSLAGLIAADPELGRSASRTDTYSVMKLALLLKFDTVGLDASHLFVVRYPLETKLEQIDSDPTAPWRFEQGKWTLHRFSLNAMASNMFYGDLMGALDCFRDLHLKERAL